MKRRRSRLLLRRRKLAKLRAHSYLRELWRIKRATASVQLFLDAFDASACDITDPERLLNPRIGKKS